MKEVIVFEHMGKTGGTSLRHSILDEIDPEKVLLCYGKSLGDHPRCLFSADFEEAKTSERWEYLYKLIDRKLADDPKIELVFGHRTPGIGYIKSRDARHFTMMRHPYTRMLSLYHRALRQWPDETPDFAKWVKTQTPLIGSALNRGKIPEYERYEKILFYEEYQASLAFMSDLLGVELKEKHSNIHPKVVERSEITDRLIDEHCSDMLRLYDHFWSRR